METARFIGERRLKSETRRPKAERNPKAEIRKTPYQGLLTHSILSAVPSGLAMVLPLLPNVETLGYYRTSLRDENEFPVALGVLAGEFVFPQ
jgi:hypothetical protein